MNEENKLKLMAMISISNNCRGRYIGLFTNIEHLVADLVIKLEYDGIAANYYKKFRTANTIFKDFWKAYEKIKQKLNGNTEFEFTFKSNLDKLLEHRNILAHWLLITDDTYVENFNGESFWLYSWKDSKDHLREYSHKIINELLKDMDESLELISNIQNTVIKYLENVQAVS